MKTKATFLALSLLFAACALNYQDVNFLSNPPGATVKFGGQTCVTPCMLTVLRGSAKPQMVEFELSGHESYYSEVVPGGIEYRNAWPHTLTATLPEKGKGTALMRSER
jgi:PEGA domain